MPLKLIPPQAGRWANYRIRGTYMGVRIDRSTGTPVKAAAQAVLKRTKEDIERGRIATVGEPTFASAALNYLGAGGQDRFLAPLNDWFGDIPLRLIDQQALDEAAVAIYPNASPATRNRQVFTPVIAIMKRANIPTPFKRPKGSQGEARTAFLTPAEFGELVNAAEAIDPELAVLFTLLCYTGLRLTEALSLRNDRVSFPEATAFAGKTKNGDPRMVHLPPVVVNALKRLPADRSTGRLFRMGKGGLLYVMAERAYADAGLDPQGAPFHMLRHTFGTWMRRYANADSRDLVDTGAWRDHKSVARYTHTVVSEAAKLADQLPTIAKSLRNRKD